MKTFFLLILLSLSAFSFQTNEYLSLYTKSGSLIADPSCKLSKSQFLKWKKIESAFLKSFTAKVKYPLVYWENGVTDSIIVSFSIDKDGHPINFKTNASKHDTLISKWGLGPIMNGIKGACMENQFDIISLNFDTLQNTVYIPVVFSVDSLSTYTIVRSGWINCIRPDPMTLRREGMPMKLPDHIR